MPRPSLLNTKPPESSKGPVLPLKALSERFEVSFAELRILWVFARIGQRHEDHPSPKALERGSIDACKTSEEVCAACPGETLYPVSIASTVAPRRTELVPCLGVLKGEC